MSTLVSRVEASPTVALVARYREHAAAHHRGYAKSRYTLGQLEAEFGDIPIADLSAFRIDKWKLARRKLEPRP